MQRRVGRIEASKLPSPELDLNPYGDVIRFSSLGETKKVAQDKWKGAPMREVTYKEYQCKIRGCKFSIQVSDNVYTGEAQDVSSVQLQKQETKSK